MITASIQTKPSNPKYPWIGVYAGTLAVMFTSKNEGFVLTSAHAPDIGTPYNEPGEEAFKTVKFITLTQDL